MRNFLVSFFSSLAIVAILGVYLIFFSDYGINKTVEAEEVSVVEEDIVEEEPEEILEVEEEEPDEEVESDFDDEITFLMLGVDALDDKAKHIRTDTIIVVNTNFKTGKINMLSIPRDTRLLVKGSLDKINHAHSYGGVDLAMETVNDFLDTDIEYYVRVDYRAVEEIVDAIGGVDIFVPRRMEYYDPTVDFRVDLYKGQQVLNGNQAMQFLRWRTNNDYTLGYVDGDVGRIQTQQYFLKEFIKQTLAPKNIIKLPWIAQSYFKRVDTNIPIGKILNGISMGRNLDSENMVTETVPGYGTYIDEISYYIYDENALEALVNEMGFKKDTSY